MPRLQQCPCGSGDYPRELRDAAGIFCCYACDECEKEKRSGYNPAAFTTGSAYVVSGDELDIDNPPDDY
mgnify:CR=1 FL=1